MTRLGWYARRLVTMSPGEIGWRAATSFRALVADRRPARADAAVVGTGHADWEDLFVRFRSGVGRPVLLDRERAAAIAVDDPDGTSAVIRSADAIVDGRVQYFGYPSVGLGDPVDWNLDPVSGTRWPAVPSRTLNHRSADGDAKWIWELNRLQHLPRLAQAWLHTGDERYARTAVAHLDSWCAQNPPGTGIAWRGAFEAGVRAISVAVALQGMRDSALMTVPRYRTALRMLDESARRCWDDRSRHSSANNHLVGELAGLAVVSLLHPELAGSEVRLSRALAGLSREADRQILPDGGGAEQAVAYQLFTSDLLLVVSALLRRDGRPVPPEIMAALTRGVRHLAVLVRDGEPTPRVGDDDEGFALRLGVEPVPDLRSHLGAVAAVTGDPVARRYGVASPTATWLSDGGEDRDGGGAEVPPERYFPDTGLVVQRSRGRRTTMDVGPLGYLSIAAHGHADALAVSLADSGGDLVGDPGAGSYYGHPGWRAAHRGTRVHATVTVDGGDQSVPGGPFLWTRHAKVLVRGVDLGAGVVDAEHDGYTRLGSPVRHRRWLMAGHQDEDVLVVDLLTGSGRHDLDVSWPLHPDLDLRPPTPGGPPEHVATREGSPVLHLLHGAHVPPGSDAPRPEAVRGDEAGGLGWWSDRLESRRPAWLVGCRFRTELPAVCATILHRPGTAPAPAGLEVVLDRDRIAVRWHVRRAGTGRSRKVTVDLHQSASVWRIFE